jgi:2-polyprenyl-3-methyl-5-hydroxy-6-metoxy-1,4-benzoquinol methylase
MSALRNVDNGKIMNGNISEIKLESISCVLCGQSTSELIAKGYDYEYWSSWQEFYFVRCLNCGHHYLNPRPTRDMADKIYPSNYYTMEGRHTSNSAIISYLKGLVVRKRLSYFKNFMKGPLNVLEVGCGDCALLIALKRRFPQINCVGVDLTFSESQRLQCSELGITLIESAIEDADLSGNKYDLVILNQLIEHLWQPVEVLKKINKSMIPTGLISIETVNISGYDRIFFKKEYWGGYYFPRHFNLFDFDALNKLLKDTGFEAIRHYSLLAPIIWAFSFHAWISRSGNKSMIFLARFFSDRNPVCLAIFTCIDSIALLFGLVTSNQKVIARRI